MEKPATAPNQTTTPFGDDVVGELPTGTGIDVAGDSPLSSGSTKVDDTFRLHALHDVKIDDNAVIAKGAHDQREVTTTTENTKTGSPVLRASEELVAPSDTGKNASKMSRLFTRVLHPVD